MIRQELLQISRSFAVRGDIGLPMNGFDSQIITANQVWTVFSLSPSCLKYFKRNAFVLWATTATVAANITLCSVLGCRFCATGAAIAYAVPVVLLYVTFAVAAFRSLGTIDQCSDEDTASGTLEEEDADEFAV